MLEEPIEAPPVAAKWGAGGELAQKPYEMTQGGGPSGV